MFVFLFQRRARFSAANAFSDQDYFQANSELNVFKITIQKFLIFSYLQIQQKEIQKLCTQASFWFNLLTQRFRKLFWFR